MNPIDLYVIFYSHFRHKLGPFPTTSGMLREFNPNIFIKSQGYSICPGAEQRLQYLNVEAGT